MMQSRILNKQRSIFYAWRYPNHTLGKCVSYYVVIVSRTHNS